MPVAKVVKPKVSKKDKKEDKVDMGREAWNKQEAELGAFETNFSKCT